MATDVRAEAIRRDVRSGESEFWAVMEHPVISAADWFWENRFRMTEMYQRAERSMLIWSERSEFADKAIRDPKWMETEQKKRAASEAALRDAEYDNDQA